MIDVRAQVASAPPAGGDAPGLIRAERINSRVFGGGNAGRLLKLRFLEAHGTVDAQGEKWVDRATILDRGPFEGRTVSDVLEPARRQPVHPLVKARGTRKQFDRDLVLNRFLDLDAAFQREHPELPPTSERYFAEFLHRHGDYATVHKLPTSPSRIIELRYRRVNDDPLTKRFNSGRKPKVLFDPEILEQCAALHRTATMDLTGAYSVFAWGQARARECGAVWAGSERRFAQLIGGDKSRPGMVTRGERLLGTEGEFAHRGRALPKMIRPRDRQPCGKRLSLDGTIDDVFVQVRGRNGKLRPGRLVIDGLMSFDSNKVWLEAGATESSDLTLRLIRRTFSDELPDVVETDGGSGFTKAIGARRGVLNEKTMENVRRVTEFYGIEVDQKPPRHAHLKPIEPFWARKNRIDATHEFFIGREREEKKLAWKRACDNVRRLPTPAERAAEIQRLGELHNMTHCPAIEDTPNEYHATHRGIVRKPDPDELELRCMTCIGTRVVRPNGIVLDGIQFGAADEEVHRLLDKRVYVWRPTGEKPPALWLTDEAGHPLAVASAQLDYATNEAVAQMKRLVARLVKRDREAVSNAHFLLEGRREQITQTIYEMRAAEERERAEAKAAEAPAVTLVASSDATRTKELKRNVGRRAVRPDAVSSAGRTLERLAEWSDGVAGTRPVRPSFVDTVAPDTAAEPRPSLWSRMTEDGRLAAEAG